MGSVAKDTFLKDPDIDIFLLFPRDLEREEIKKIGLEIGKRILPEGFAKYAEHPYWHGVFNGFEVDIVPCYRIRSVEELKSAVDRTPFHTEYVKNHLKDWQRDEVRLLKVFLKGIEAYGAEAKIQGFSGYLTELLILKYGSFEDVLKNASRWRRRTYLYLEEKGGRFQEPLVFIDPVDPRRNAASAVSEEKKFLFVHASRCYLKNPKIEFFFPREQKTFTREEILKKMDERETYFLVSTFPKPDIVEDNLYPQIRRTLEIFTKILEDFGPLTSFYTVTEHFVHFIIELERYQLPAVKLHEGPPVWHANTTNFLSRWKSVALRGPYIKGYRWYVEIKREIRNAPEILIKDIDNYKLGKWFEKNKKIMKISNLRDTIDKMDLKSLSEFFDFRFPWER